MLHKSSKPLTLSDSLLPAEDREKRIRLVGLSRGPVLFTTGDPPLPINKTMHAWPSQPCMFCGGANLKCMVSLWKVSGMIMERDYKKKKKYLFVSPIQVEVAVKSHI